MMTGIVGAPGIVNHRGDTNRMTRITMTKIMIRKILMKRMTTM
jgi:hypothetical protein